MKFISKSTNLYIVLRPGMSAQPLTGSPAVPTISVRFQNGVAEVNDAELIEKMYTHPGFNQDFIAADEVGTDPYAANRSQGAPQHVTTELLYGHPVKRTIDPAQSALPKELQSLIQAEAVKLAQAMIKDQLPGLVKATLESLASNTATTTEVTSEAIAAEEPVELAEPKTEAPADATPAKPEASKGNLKTKAAAK